VALISIARNALKSEVVRKLAGERLLDTFRSLNEDEIVSRGDGGGLLGKLITWAYRLGGFIVNVIYQAGRWLLRNLWDIILTVSYEIAYFDWNQSDAQIQAQIRANNLGIVAQLGELVGVGSVWLASVAIAGLATLKWPVVAGKVLLDLAEEGGDEIRAELRGVLSSAKNAISRNAVLGLLLGARRLNLFGLEPVSEPREPWILSEKIEERVESIENDFTRVFVENFLEGSVDALIEVGYVVSYSIEDYYRAAELAQSAALGEKRGVEIQFDDRVAEEKIIVSGRQELAMQTVENALTTHRLIYGRDVGQVVGMPLPDFQRAGIHRRKLTIVFKSKQSPPWVNPPGQDPVREANYSIPEVRVGLTWNEIKRAARPWNWGRYRCTANFENGRQMAIYGATESEAQDKLRELAALSTLEILTISISKEGDRHPNLRKDPVRMYPAYSTLTVRKRTTEPNGVIGRNGDRFSSESQRWELWPDTEPANTRTLL